MAARTLKVVRLVDGAETVLFETNLNEDEKAKLRRDRRPDQIAENNPGIEEANEVEDLIVLISTKELDEAKAAEAKANAEAQKAAKA